MSSERTSLDYLRDILEAVRLAQTFVQDLSYSTFEYDTKTHFAAVRALEIVGEAAKNVGQEVRENYSEIPWREMARTRDKLSHGYFGIDLKRVWLTIQEDLPALEPKLARVLDDLEAEEQSSDSS